MSNILHWKPSHTQTHAEQLFAYPISTLQEYHGHKSYYAQHSDPSSIISESDCSKPETPVGVMSLCTCFNALINWNTVMPNVCCCLHLWIIKLLVVCSISMNGLWLLCPILEFFLQEGESTNTILRGGQELLPAACTSTTKYSDCQQPLTSRTSWWMRKWWRRKTSLAQCFSESQVSLVTSQWLFLCRLWVCVCVSVQNGIFLNVFVLVNGNMKICLANLT